MVSLKHSISAHVDKFVKIQSIIQKDYNDFDPYPELIQRFRCICSNIFKYVDSWYYKIIISQTYRLLSKKHIERETLDIFHNHLVQNYTNNPTSLINIVAIDLQKLTISYDPRLSGLETSKIIDIKCKENNTLLFEVGLVYMYTYSDSLKVDPQKCILLDLPDQETMNNFGPIKILLAPPGWKEVQYDSDATKQ